MFSVTCRAGGGKKSEVISFISLLRLHVLLCIFCVLCKSGKLNDDCAGNLPRHSYCKPGNINFSLWTFVFPLHIPEMGVKLCLAVLLSRIQLCREIDMVKSEKADKETLLICLVML